MKSYIIAALFFISGTLSQAQINADGKIGFTRTDGITAENTYPLLVNSVNALDKELPTLTPKEKEWVESELKNLEIGSLPIGSARATKLLMSKEYHLFLIRDHIDKLKSSLSLLKKATSENDIKLISLLWVSTSMELADASKEIKDALGNYFKDEKVKLSRLNMPQYGIHIVDQEHVFVWWDSWSQSIWEGFAKEKLMISLEIKD